MIFENYKEITSHLVDETEAAIASDPRIVVELGYSNVSCSAYVSASVLGPDEDGDMIETLGECKIRFSDHADRYESDLTIRFDEYVDDDQYEEEGILILEDWRIEEMLSEAVDFINKEIEEQLSE